MATITAAAGGGNWSSTSTWVGGVVPTAADNVRLASTSGNVTINTGAMRVCRSLDCTGYTGTLTHNGVILAMGDGTAGAGNIALKFVSTMTYTANTGSRLDFYSSSGTVQSVTMAGKSCYVMVYWGVGASWQLQDNLTVTNYLYLGYGTLDTNGKSVTCLSFYSSYTSARTLTLGASTFTCTSTTAPWDCTTTTNMTLNRGTSTIVLSGSGNRTFNGGGLTYYNVTQSVGPTVTINEANTFNTWTVNGGISSFTVANTFVNLTLSGFVGLSLPKDVTTTITGTLEITGLKDTRIIVGVKEVQGTATLSAATTTLTDVIFINIIATGAGSWSGTRVGDGGDNSGITFTTPQTKYWVGNGGDWSDGANHWATSSGGSGNANNNPLPQDDTIFDENSFSSDGQTVTCNIAYMGKHWDVSAISNTVTFSMSAIFFLHYGDITWHASKATISGPTVSWLDKGGTITCNGGSLGPLGITSSLYRFGQVISLADNFSTPAAQLSLDSGTFNANNHDVNILYLTTSATNTRTINMGSGIWTLGRTSGAVWDVTNATGLTLNEDTSTIVISDTGSGNKTFIGGGQAYNNLSITGGGTGTVTITGTNTFNNVNIGRPKTAIFPASTTTTISGRLFAMGDTGNVITLQSSSAGSAATISQSGGRVITNFCSIKDFTKTGSVWYAGKDSTNVSGNSGITFTAPKRSMLLV